MAKLHSKRVKEWMECTRGGHPVLIRRQHVQEISLRDHPRLPGQKVCYLNDRPIDQSLEEIMSLLYPEDGIASKSLSTAKSRNSKPAAPEKT